LGFCGAVDYGFKDDPDKGRKAGVASPKRRLTQLTEDMVEVGILGHQ